MDLANCFQESNDEEGVTPPSQHSSPARRSTEDFGVSERQKSGTGSGEGDASHQFAEGDQSSESSSEDSGNQSTAMDMSETSSGAGQPSAIPAQQLSSRQLSKRPMANDDADAERPLQRARRQSSLEGTVNPDKSFKCEPATSASGSAAPRPTPHDVSHHIHCTQDPRDRCRDPEIGVLIPAYDKFQPPPGVVYATEDKWQAGKLNDEQVQFIMSYCPCTVTEFLRGAWVSMVAAKPSNARISKYTLLSHRYTEQLNKFIKQHCPGPPQRPGEVIEIMED